MPRYEIVAHVTRELDCATAEEAAAIVRRHVLTDPAGAANLMHLAVWRQDPPPAVSSLPSSVRHKLVDFFATLQRCADEAEEAFRGQVEALLMAEPLGGQQPAEGSAATNEA